MDVKVHKSVGGHFSSRRSLPRFRAFFAATDRSPRIPRETAQSANLGRETSLFLFLIQLVERETRGNRKKASREFMEIFTRCPHTRKRHRRVSRLVFLA